MPKLPQSQGFAWSWGSTIYSQVEWNWFADVIAAAGAVCIQWRHRTEFSAPVCTSHPGYALFCASVLVCLIYGIIAKTKVVIGASQPEARGTECCDASYEAVTPFHTINARDFRPHCQCSVNHSCSTWRSLRKQTGKGHGFRKSMAIFWQSKNWVGPNGDQKKFELSSCLETTWQGINIELKEVAGSNWERFQKVYTWRLAVRTASRARSLQS